MAIDFSKLSDSDRAAVAQHFGQAAPAPVAKPAKFRNQRTEVGGLTFDSKKEARIWLELTAREAAGGIRSLRRQVCYALEVHGQHIADYYPDFEWFEGDVKITADVKSKATKTPVYQVKKKLMAAIHGIAILEL